MKRILSYGLRMVATLVLFWWGFASVSPAQADEYTIHNIRYGQTLSGISLQYRVPQKAIETANGITNPDRIFAGHTLHIPRNVKVAKTVKRSTTGMRGNVMEVGSSSFKRIPVKVWKHPGGNPYREVRIDRDLEAIGIPNAVARTFASMIEQKAPNGVGFLERSGRVWRPHMNSEGVWEYDIVSMFWGSGSHKYYAQKVDIQWVDKFFTDNKGIDFLPIDIYTIWAEGSRYDIGVVWVCGNIAILQPRRPPPTQKVELPPALAPPVSQEPKPTPQEKREDLLAKWLNRMDLFVGLGEEYPDAGGTTRFQFGRGALYPLVFDTPQGRHQFGGAVRFSLVDGKTFDRFHFDGSMVVGGPSYKYYHWKGWDLTFEPMVGYLDEHGRSRDRNYRSHRRFSIAGFAVNANYYKRELKGLKWFPETQFYAGLFWDFDTGAHHQWQGQSIKDTRELRKFDGLYSVGLRQFIYDDLFGFLRPFIGLEFFAEMPQTAKLNPCLGLSDKYKIVFGQVCASLNVLKSGSYDGFLWSVGIDIAQAGRFWRTHARTIQAQRALQYDQTTGEEVLIPTDISIH